MHCPKPTLLAAIVVAVSLTHARPMVTAQHLAPLYPAIKNAAYYTDDDYFAMDISTTAPGGRITFGLVFPDRPRLPTVCLDVIWERGADRRIVDFTPEWGICGWKVNAMKRRVPFGFDRREMKHLSDLFYREAAAQSEKHLWPTVRADIAQRKGDVDIVMDLAWKVGNWTWEVGPEEEAEAARRLLLRRRGSSEDTVTDVLPQNRRQNQGQKGLFGSRSRVKVSTAVC